LAYIDELNRMTQFTDTLGNVVLYDYDEMGRVTKITPAQGSGYRTEYAYNPNGSLDSVDIYVAGTPETTTYTYDTTSGKLTQRDLPTVTGANMRMLYHYDSAGRLDYEQQQKHTGGAGGAWVPAPAAHLGRTRTYGPGLPTVRRGAGAAPGGRRRLEIGFRF
jgi:YD repeat-containing protein